MRFRPLAALAVLLFALPLFSQQSPTRPPSSASAPNSTPPQARVRDPQALALLQASVQAMGGTPPSDSTATGTVTQTVGAQSDQGTIQVLTRGTSQSSEAIALPNSSQTIAFASWMGSQASDSAPPQDISAQLAASSQTVIFPLPLFAGAIANADESFQYVGVETIETHSANHIRFWNTFTSKSHLVLLSSFTSRDVWLDASTNLPLKISFTQQAAEGNSPKYMIQLNFSNYTQSSGFAYPQQITKSINGTPSLTISIQTIAFNTGLTDSNFPVNCSGTTN